MGFRGSFQANHSSCLQAEGPGAADKEGLRMGLGQRPSPVVVRGQKGRLENAEMSMLFVGKTCGLVE